MKVLQLTRLDYLNTGIFGALIDPDSSFAAFTLEHSYPVVPDSTSVSTNYAPKIPAGTYKCLRGLHKLEGMTEPFETFEINGVEGHTNLLFHAGNFNKDSEGCVLLGLDRQGDTAILESREAFFEFMKNLKDLNEFTLEIS